MTGHAPADKACDPRPVDEDDTVVRDQDEPDSEEIRRHTGQMRLGLLAAADEAIRRHDEILPLIAASADSSEAEAAISALLGTDENGARVVLNLQWSALLPEQRARFARDRAEQQRALER